MTQNSNDLVDLVKKLSPQDGDILQLPADAPPDLSAQLLEALTIVRPGIKCLVLRGELHRLNVGEMNAAGWYRA